MKQETKEPWQIERDEAEEKRKAARHALIEDANRRFYLRTCARDGVSATAGEGEI